MKLQNDQVTLVISIKELRVLRKILGHRSKNELLNEDELTEQEYAIFTQIYEDIGAFFVATA